jgi:hypothetical protein
MEYLGFRMSTIRHFINIIESVETVLLEGRDAPLYHQMHSEKAKEVFTVDALMARKEPQTLWAYDGGQDPAQAPGETSERPYQKSAYYGGLQALYGNSFTRNPRLDLTQGGGYGRKIVSLFIGM